ncbi:hypothetical protein Tco_0771614 [Tanacetum coccineum]|uniref:Uncharacterized protein n=1 Tax=Tanacetum coccineum TaxID=301880 RepID=A0ABQ4ZFG8_9ASTR
MIMTSVQKQGHWIHSFKHYRIHSFQASPDTHHSLLTEFAANFVNRTRISYGYRIRNIEYQPDSHFNEATGFAVVTRYAVRSYNWVEKFLEFPYNLWRYSSYSITKIVILGGVHPDLVSPGDYLVLSKEVVNDNFDESRVVHLILLFIGSVVNLVNEIFPK